MFDHMLDDFRKATESTMRVQQQMLEYWTRQWGEAPAAAGKAAKAATGATAAGRMPLAADTLQSMQHQWTSAVLDLLKKHRQTLDAQYEAGLRTIEDAFRVGEARDPEQFRRLSEELWRHSFDALKTVTEDQMKELEQAGRKWMQAASGS